MKIPKRISQKPYKNSIKILSKFYQNSIKILSKILQKPQKKIPSSFSTALES